MIKKVIYHILMKEVKMINSSYAKGSYSKIVYKYESKYDKSKEPKKSREEQYIYLINMLKLMEIKVM